MGVLARAEREAGLDTLRPLSAQFVEPLFAWSLGASWEELPVPAGAALGDVVRAARNLYSLLRQLDRALPADHPLLETVREGRRAMERDLLVRV
jgi:superfamily II RNA helicase